LLLADERPQLITFHVSHLNVANSFSHDAFTFLASEDEDLENCFLVSIRSQPIRLCV
jgi:hypothetical protein